MINLRNTDVLSNNLKLEIIEVQTSMYSFDICKKKKKVLMIIAIDGRIIRRYPIKRQT